MNKASLIATAAIVLLLAVTSTYLITSKQQADWQTQTAELKSGLAGFQDQLAKAREDLASLRSEVQTRDAEAESLKAQMLHLEEQLAKVREKAEKNPLAAGMALDDEGVARMIPMLLKNVMALGGEGEAEEDVEIELLEKAELEELEKLKEAEAERPGEDNAKAERHEKILQRVREQAGPEMADIVREALKNAGKPGKMKTTHRVFRFPGGREGHVVIKVDGVELGGDEKPAQKPPPVKENF